MAARRVVLASHNRKKLVELERILSTAELDVVLVSAAELDVPDVPETGATFAENAVLKAETVAAFTALPAIADDSGLAVDALNGMPGVLSARWSGRHGQDEANLDLVLAQLSDVPDGRRGAAFVCAAAYVQPGQPAVVCEEQVRGHLLRARRGEEGFGYDPIFVPDGHHRTTAQMPAAEKDELSHRGKALRALAEQIAAVGGRAGGGTRTRTPEGTGS